MERIERVKDWKVSKGKAGYIVRSPRGETVPMALKAASDSTVGNALKRLNTIGFSRDEEPVLQQEQLEREAALAKGKDTSAAERRAEAARQAEEARLTAAAQAQAAAETDAAAAAKKAAPVKKTPPAVAVPTAPFTPATALQRLGLTAASQPSTNGNSNPTTTPTRAPAAAAPLVVSHQRVVPAALVGVAGLASLDERMDLSQIIIDPEDAPKPGYHQVTVYQLVTPDLAEKWLARPVGWLDDGTMLVQRPIAPASVDFHSGTLRRDLELAKQGEGEWAVAEDAMLAPEDPINTGGVIDGRHRFTSIARTGIPAIMKITYNTPPKVFLTLDKGRSRSMADNLKTLSIAGNTHFASALKAIFCWEEYILNPTGPYGYWRNWSRMRPSDSEAIRMYQKILLHPVTGESLIDPHVKPGTAMMSKVKGVAAAGILFRYAVYTAWAKANPDGSYTMPAKAEELFESYCATVEYGEAKRGNPGKTLYDWLYGGSANVARNHKREFQVNGLMRGWEYFAKGKTYASVIVPEDTAMPMPYVPSQRYAAGRAAYFGETVAE